MQIDNDIYIENLIEKLEWILEQRYVYCEMRSKIMTAATEAYVNTNLECVNELRKQICKNEYYKIRTVVKNWIDKL